MHLLESQAGASATQVLNPNSRKRGSERMVQLLLLADADPDIRGEGAVGRMFLSYRGILEQKKENTISALGVRVSTLIRLTPKLSSKPQALHLVPTGVGVWNLGTGRAWSKVPARVYSPP